ncbi:hypothetical protein HFN60_31105 [Rhizobium leguminosarum]|uniref:hypothetical protein n=1 Tax=Rhizobium leguminosarum TaxID=384 RepID=UPI001C97ACED|nr:hypothetical protein [Rhizobium leguminosarum]MBY5820042.1 hypothetical protein [Rhizobium leguminosarum]
MRWFPTISENAFTSVINETDQTSTGKWIIPQPGSLWEEIDAAIIDGRLAAVKKARDHSVALVYCRSSDEETVAETLAILRQIGVDGELQYKTDKATDERRERYLYSSTDFEHPSPQPF